MQKDNIYKELSDPKHPVNQAKIRMEAVEEVRIIEGKKLNGFKQNI